MPEKREPTLADLAHTTLGLVETAFDIIGDLQLIVGELAIEAGRKDLAKKVQKGSRKASKALKALAAELP